jgi:hypothetical protein
LVRQVLRQFRLCDILGQSRFIKQIVRDGEKSCCVICQAL